MTSTTNDFFMVHKPILPPRKGDIGEQVFASMWEALMTHGCDELLDLEDQPITDVLHAFYRPVEQRDASVLASAVCWLGCSIGSGVLDHAEHKVGSGHWRRETAYLLAWTEANARASSINFGVRYVEYILAPRELRRTPIFLMDSGLSELPTLSADDLEVIDHLMLWLATMDGQSFLRQCRAEEKRLREEHALADRAARLRPLGAEA